MPGLHSETHYAQPQRTQQPFNDQAAPSRAEQDDTTLKFEGRMAVSDLDTGSDPYNRTGKFRRLVR